MLLKQRVYRGVFPFPELEARFRVHYHTSAVDALRRGAPFILSLLVLSGGLMLVVFPWAAHHLWTLAYALVSLSLCLTYIFAARWGWSYPPVAALCGFAGLSAAAGIPLVVEDPELLQVTSYGALFCYVAFYSLGHLRWQLLAQIAWGSAALVLVMAKLGSLPLDPVGWGLYALGSNAFGLGIAFLNEQRARYSYLQARMLELEKIELDRLSEELSRLSREDPLTGLPNRRSFDERLALEWRRSLRNANPITLFFVDIDDFKRFNDHFGHDAGDTCLKAVAEAIASQARRAGELAARYGGEEFVVLFPEMAETELESHAVGILSAVEALKLPHPESTVAPHVTVSLGAATLVPSEEHAPNALLKLADGALYQAKGLGKNTWVNATPQ